MKKVIIGLFIIVMSFIITEEHYVVIPEEAIRFRVIPASNSVKDVLIKNKVTSELLSLLNADNGTINESREEIIKLVPSMEYKINEIFKEYDYEEDFDISYGINHFPKKIYSEVLYKEGDYESLVVTIGKGLGDNFWCVLFPPLCALDTDENTKDIEYKFKVSEILSKVMNNI